MVFGENEFIVRMVLGKVWSSFVAKFFCCGFFYVEMVEAEG